MIRKGNVLGINKILKDKRTPYYLGIQIFYQFTWSILTYGEKSWNLTLQININSEISQRPIERIMIRITLKKKETK